MTKRKKKEKIRRGYKDGLRRKKWQNVRSKEGREE